MTWINKEIAVLLPARDESLTIRESLIRFHGVMPCARLIVIDNNSSDKTAEIAKATIDELQCDGEVIFVAMAGKGKALQSAFEHVEADAYLICDADLTYPIEDAPKLLEMLFDTNSDMVVGERLSKGDYRLIKKRRFHYAGNKILTALINLLFTKQYHDVASGFRAINRNFIEGFTVRAIGFEFEADISIHAAIIGAETVDFPVSYQDRPVGSLSKLNTYTAGWAYIKMIFSRFVSHSFQRLTRS